MPHALPTPLQGFLDAVASADRAPAGAASAGVALALGMGLFLKALRNPPPGVAADKAQGDVELIESLRKRVLKQIEAATRAEAVLPAHDGRSEPPAGPGARLPAYRAARTLVDLAVQGLGQVKPTLDWGGTALLADLEAGWRLQGAALEAAVAYSEDQLKHLPADLVAGEAEALATQAAYGRELQARAQAELAWSRGKTE